MTRGQQHVLRWTAIVACGLLVAVLVFRSYTRPDAIAGEARQVPVYVLQRPIPKGTPLAEAARASAVGERTIPQNFYPQTAVRNATQLDGVAAFDLPKGLILQDGFVMRDGRPAPRSDDIVQLDSLVSGAGSQRGPVLAVYAAVPAGMSGDEALRTGRIAPGVAPGDLRFAAVDDGAELNGREAVVALAPGTVVVRGMFA